MTGLLGLAMKRVTAEERIVFFLLQTSRSVWALFVTGGHVTGSGFAFGFRLSAFESDDVLGHGGRGLYASYSLVSTVDSSSSVSLPSSSVRPKSEVTDWRTRVILFCFSRLDWQSTV